MISAEKIALMKKSAIFINCARGPIVDGKALAQALNEGRIAGAAVDVFDCEPPIPAEEPLLHAKNTLLTPHVAFLSEEAMVRRVGGNTEVQHHLENLGFVPGSTVKVITMMGGNLIVQVKEARVAISSEMAQKIMV